MTKEQNNAYGYGIHYGMEAYKRGLKCIPARDEIGTNYCYKELAPGAKVGDKITMAFFKGWQAGWFSLMNAKTNEQLRAAGVI